MPREYHVIVREVYKTIVAIEANSPEEAIQKVWMNEGETYPNNEFAYRMRPEHWTVEDPEDYTPPMLMKTFNRSSGEFTISGDPLEMMLPENHRIPWQPIKTAPLDGTLVESKDEWGQEDVVCYQLASLDNGKTVKSMWLSITMDYLPTKTPKFWRPIQDKK
jgi:hypothetical protein